MNCPNCSQPVEAGAAFCGNCGQPLQAPAVPPQQAAAPPQPNLVGPVPGAGLPAAQNQASPIAQAFASQPPTVATPPSPLPGGMAAPMVGGGVAAVPAYSVPAAHPGETQAIIALLLSVMSLPGALLPIAGVVLGISGVVTGSLGLRVRKGLSMAALIVGTVGVIASLGMWVWAAQHDSSSRGAGGVHHSAVLVPVDTPCYSFRIASDMKVVPGSGACDTELYDGSSVDESSDAYNVIGDKIPNLTQDDFITASARAIDQVMKSDLPDATVVSKDASATFAGSPAYVVTATVHSKNVSMVMAAVMQETAHGENYFVLSHAIKGSSVDLSALENAWHWK